LIGVLVLPSFVPSGVAASTDGAMTWVTIENSDEQRNSLARKVRDCILFPSTATEFGRLQS
jgi:hypothetical protein